MRNLAQLLAGRCQPHKLLALAKQMRGGVLVPLCTALDTAVFAGTIYAMLTLEPGILASTTRVAGSKYAPCLRCLVWELEAHFEALATIVRCYVDQLRLSLAAPRWCKSVGSGGGDWGEGAVAEAEAEVVVPAVMGVEEKPAGKTEGAVVAMTLTTMLLLMLVLTPRRCASSPPQRIC